MKSVSDKLSASAELLRRLYFLARPYSLAKPLLLLALILAQSILQVIGVTSIFPFLALASDPEHFRNSGIGSKVVSFFPSASDKSLLLWAGCFSIAILVLSNAVNTLSDYARSHYAHSLGHWLRFRLLRQIAARPWNYFLMRNSGELLKKAVNDVMQMVVEVLVPLAEATARAASILLLVILLMFINVKVAVVAAVVIALYYGAVFRASKALAWRLSNGRKFADRGAMREAQQMLAGIKTIKIHHAEDAFVERYSLFSAKQAKVNALLPILYNGPKYLFEPVAFGGVVLLVMSFALSGKGMDALVPTLGVVGLAGYRLLPAAQLLYAQLSQISTMRHTVDEVYEEFQGVEGSFPVADINRLQTPLSPFKWRKEMRLEAVSFAYSGSKTSVLDQLNLVIPKYSSLGIVGETGSGKSTLVDIILGLHRPSHGSLLVDGRLLGEDVSMESWQAGIGYVPQDIFLIDDTVARNIAFGVPDAAIDEERLHEAAEAAQILSFIEKELPSGFASQVGERGVRLSGGQRQRIALARALYRRPELLVLDEATSALDNETEAQVVEAINNLQGAVTLVVVAHRLSTIERCQNIVELSRGKATTRLPAAI